MHSTALPHIFVNGDRWSEIAIGEIEALHQFAGGWTNKSYDIQCMHECAEPKLLGGKMSSFGRALDTSRGRQMVMDGHGS